VLVKLNPFGILCSELLIKVISSKSPKDFNMNNPERSSGYKQKGAVNPEGLPFGQARVE